MPTPKEKRDYAKEQNYGNKKEAHLERQRARRLLDKMGVDRKGKHVDHVKPISQGGKSTASNLRLSSPSANMQLTRNSDGTVKSQRGKKERS